MPSFLARSLPHTLLQVHKETVRKTTIGTKSRRRRKEEGEAEGEKGKEDEEKEDKKTTEGDGAGRISIIILEEP